MTPVDLADLTPFVQLGSSGILLASIVWFGRYFIRLISSGEWVSRRELDYVREDRNARLQEKDDEIRYLRGAHETSERARELLNVQNRELVGSFRTFEHFFDSMRRIVEGGPDVPTTSRTGG